MKTCGTCKHAVAPDDPAAPADVRICFGGPPSVAIVPQQRITPAADRMANPNLPPVQMVMVQQTLRPPVSVTDRACGVWQEQEE
jgi:hypothetical protein